MPALWGLILGLAAVVTIAASGIGYRLGWWHFTRGLQVSEWATYGPMARPSRSSCPGSA
jgi:hypothetical protein